MIGRLKTVRFLFLSAFIEFDDLNVSLQQLHQLSKYNSLIYHDIFTFLFDIWVLIVKQAATVS